MGIASDFCEGRDWDSWPYLGRLHGTTPHFEINVPEPNPVIEGLKGSFDMPNVAEGLRSRGYRDVDVAKVMGGNWLRLYQAVWRS